MGDQEALGTLGARRALESLIALQRWNSLELRTLGGLGDSGAQGALRFL